jgi:hypothetical protein
MALTNASRLADFGTGIGTQGAILQVDNVDQRVGIGTTDPDTKLEVKGTIKGIDVSVSGASTITGNLEVGGNIDLTGNITIGGTLTYEDVTNVDSLGIVTARSGINMSGGQFLVGTGVTIGVAGVATFRTGRIDVGDSLSNTSIGELAGDAYTTGSYNAAVGYNALTEDTTGGFNVAVGAFTLDVNTTGANNTAIGYAALSANTTASNVNAPTATLNPPVVSSVNAL